MINKETVITLDNNKKYVLVNEVEIDSETYLYLVEVENAYSFMFVKRSNNRLIKIIDSDLINQILQKMEPKDIE